jgi:lipoprotein-anchoring transpeptidase ErfK/SrfK
VSSTLRTRRIALAAASALAVLLIGGAAALVLVGTAAGPSPADSPLPPSPRSPVTPKNVPLGPTPAAHWAPVVAGTAARRVPGGSAVVAKVPTRTPEGTTNIVVLLGRTERRAGRLWVLVRLPTLREDARGWVPRRFLGGYIAVRTRLVVDRDQLTATLLRDGRPVFRSAVGVGKPATPTPRGEFYVRNRLHKYRSPFYGPVAFGTSARSSVASDWPAGGFVGIHGTNRPDLLPGRVSAGCIRMGNREIVRMARLMPVGTPVSVR